MFGELNEKEIEILIHRQFIGRIGCHADDTTYVVPVSYAYDGESIYGHTYEGLKVNLMRKNPKVCFQVDDMHDMANWQSVIAWGEFEELKNVAERAHAIEILIARTLPLIHSETMHLSPNWPFHAKEATEIDGIIFRIVLKQKTGRFEKSAAGLFFAS